MVGVLHRDAHALEHEDTLTTQVVARVERHVVEVPAAIEGLDALGVLEVEVLDGGAQTANHAAVVGLVAHPAQHGSRVALKRLAGGSLDVAEHARGTLFLGAPRQDLER